jgi:hypothetical protein
MMARWFIAAVFGVIVALFAAVEVGSRRPGSHWAAVSLLAAGVLGRRSTRVAVIVVWWWIGWHFLVAP